MDDTALNPQLQQPIPTQGSTQVPVQNALQSDAVRPVPPQQPAPPVAPQQPISQHPEQGPVASGLPAREAAPVADSEAVATVSDDQAVVPDGVSDAADIQHEAAPAIAVQEAHPAVEVSPQLQEAGVEKGKDAEREHLPEEQLAKIDEVTAQPDTQTAASGISLASTPLQVEEVKKRAGIRDSLKWLATYILRQLKKIQAGNPANDTPAVKEEVK
jgi:hypothetical protein